jgi:hypothetical protein
MDNLQQVFGVNGAQVVTDIRVLSTELTTTEKNLRVALAATLRERAQLLDLFAAREQFGA